MTKEIKVIKNYKIKDFGYYKPLRRYNVTLIIKPINPIQNGINILF